MLEIPYKRFLNQGYFHVLSLIIPNILWPTICLCAVNESYNGTIGNFWFIFLMMKVNQIALILTVISLSLVLISGCKKKSESKIDQIMNADKDFKFPTGFPPDP